MSKLTRRRFLSITAATSAVTLLSGGASKSYGQPSVWTGRVMGADASIKFYDDTGRSKKALDAALLEIKKFERQLSIYDPSSALSQLNLEGHFAFEEEKHSVPELLAISKRIHANTEGLFDPTIQPVFSAYAKAEGYPSQDELSAANSLVSLDQVTLGADKILRFTKSGMAMTFNGIAQGFITDKVRQVLNDHGYTKSLINIGEYSAGDRTAKIGVSDATGEIFEITDLRNQAIATSSPGGYRFLDGTSHIFYPDGKKRKAYWDTVSIIAANATIADGYSTALALTENSDLAERLVAQGILQKVFMKSVDGNTYQV